MNRFLVALLAVIDAVIVVAAGLAVALAPLTVLWVFGLGEDAVWSALWPAAVKVWQAGNLVPLHVDLGAEYAVAVGIPESATSFVFSLAPLAFTTFTVVFAARSGARATRAGSWVVGVVSGTLAVAILSAAVAVTSHVAEVGVDLLPAIAFPTAIFGIAALTGALVDAWREGDDGLLDRARDRFRYDDTGVVEASARGAVAALVGVLGIGALLVAVATALTAGDVVALYESAHVDLVGAVMLALGQLLYLPTLVIWGAAYAAGPGIALGAGTTVAPSGTTLGVLPGIPVFGMIPEDPSSWLLLLSLLIVAVGAFAGYVARARLRAFGARDDSIVIRAVTLVVLVALTAAGVALLGWVSGGSLGPGRLADVGPHVGLLTLVVSAEIAIGAAAVLLSPARSDADEERALVPTDARSPGAETERPEASFADLFGTDEPDAELSPASASSGSPDDQQTAPIDPLDPDATAPIDPLAPDDRPRAGA